MSSSFTQVDFCEGGDLPFGEWLVGVVEYLVPGLGPREAASYLRPELLRLLQGPPKRLKILVAVERVRPSD